MPKYLVTVRAALSHLDSVIELKGTQSRRKSNNMEIVEEFALHLKDISGLAAATCIAQRRYAAEFIKHCFRFRAINWRKIQNKHVISFVTSYGSRCSAAAAAQEIKRDVGPEVKAFLEKWKILQSGQAQNTEQAQREVDEALAAVEAAMAELDSGSETEDETEPATTEDEIRSTGDL